jgi:hypothetical protein
MLAAVSGLAYLVATILKLENTVGYFLPLPVVLAAMRSGHGVGWKTMGATAFLLVGECKGARNARAHTRPPKLPLNSAANATALPTTTTCSAARPPSRRVLPAPARRRGGDARNAVVPEGRLDGKRRHLCTGSPRGPALLPGAL